MSILSTYQSNFQGNEDENFQFMKRMTIKGLKCKGVYDEMMQIYLEDQQGVHVLLVLFVMV